MRVNLGTVAVAQGQKRRKNWNSRLSVGIHTRSQTHFAHVTLPRGRTLFQALTCTLAAR